MPGASREMHGNTCAFVFAGYVSEKQLQPDALATDFLLLGMLAEYTYICHCAGDAEVDFIAYFSPDTSPCFDVEPVQGKLKAKRHACSLSPLKIRFKNTGKPGQKGVLFVQTSDCTRAFEVKGEC